MRVHTTATCVGAALGAFVLAAASIGFTQIAAAANPNALWEIVDQQCVPAEKATGTPGKCANVDLAQRYAILKDIEGIAQYLLIPTDRISGIESPRVTDATLPDYWAEAWAARRYVDMSLKQPLAANRVGLEINSQYRRSQQQLHIHIDCMRGDIVDALARHRNDTPGVWTWDMLGDSRYRVMRVTSLTQADDPFRIVARDRPTPPAMATQTILVTGASASTAQNGWLIVNSGTDLDGGSGSAEDLLDHTCSMAAAR